MAEVTLTIMTVASPIPTGTGGANPYTPYSGNFGPITLDDPQLGTITLTDDDPNFQNARLTPGETDQRLVSETVLGSGSYAQTLPAGTQLSAFSGSVLVGNGGVYHVMFPRISTATSYGDPLGGKTVVIILPQPVTDENGDTVLVPFDPAQTYYWTKNYNFGGTDPNQPYSYAPLDVDCFATGTRIAMADGRHLPVERLRAGDLVATRDNGAQPVAWVGGTHVGPMRLDLQPNLRPIRIARGALGGGLPERDLVVSPQHRMLVRSRIAGRMFGSDEALVAAKHLASLPGFAVENPAQGVGYWHLLFSDHQIVRANGAWAESLFTGPQAMAGLGAAARREILALFPQLAGGVLMAPGARQLLTGREGRGLARRLEKNEKPVFADG